MTGRLGEEDGSVLVVAGIMLLAFALLGGVIVEAGQWFEHRRAIQVRADAAALAGGQQLAECFNVGINGVTESSVDSDIEGWAKSYGGLTGASTQANAPYNPQFGTSSSDLMSFQSDTYPSAGNPTPPPNLGPECYRADGTPNLMLDVKVSQEGIPSIFNFSNFSPLATVHGWARVQLQQVQSLVPSMPLAIPDVRPKQVAVTFVNNATGAALSNCPNGCVFQLSGPTTSGQLNDWGTTATIPAAAMPAANGNVGMRVGIGSQVGSCAGVNQTATYTCYDYSTTGQPAPDGIIDLRTYDSATAGSASAPVLRAVTPSTCSGTPFFSVYQMTGTTCSAGVTAVVDFGAGGPPSGAAVQATINGTTVPLANTAGTNSWTSNAVSLPLEGGPYSVTMAWCASSCSQKNNFKPFNSGNPVQQIFSGSDGSSSVLPGGPIFAASVLNNSDGSALYSFPAGQGATLAVTLGLTGGVHLPSRCSNGTSGGSYSCATDPPVLLRFTTGSGNDSQTYAIDCGTIPGGTGGTLYQQIRYGCLNPFSFNTADVCPDPANPSPPDCAPVQTGAATGQVTQAMNDRFAPNGVCDPNNYPDYPPNDPRAVTLVITDFSAFTGSGGSPASNVPVVTFATFYVTGWDSAASSCTSGSSPINEPPPAADAGNGKGSNIWGHFIADVNLKGTPSGKTCPGAGIVPCVPALVR